MNPAIVERPSVHTRVNGRPYTVAVRESAQVKKMRIVVGPRQPLQVVVPAGTAEDQVRRFLCRKRRWIDEKVAASEVVAGRPSLLGFDAPGVVWAGGIAIAVHQHSGRRMLASVDSTGRLVVSGPPDHQVRAIELWYRREARRRLQDVVSQEAARLGLEYASIGIRDPKTRWGSCSRKRHLSFSWRLVLAPPEIMRYVAIHELCHLVEPNHSKSFWRVLEAACPGWQEAARWLRERGHELHGYDPTVAVDGERGGAGI